MKILNHLRQNFLRGNFYCRKHKLVRKEEEIFIEGYKLIRKKDNKKAFLYINKREDTLYKKKLNFMDQQSYPIFIIDFKGVLRLTRDKTICFARSRSITW